MGQNYSTATKPQNSFMPPTLRIQTTVQVFDVVELDVHLPYYCKTDEVYYRVVTPTHALRVTVNNDFSTLMICNPEYEHTKQEIAKAPACTEHEFYQAFLKAYNNIQKVAVMNWEPKEGSEATQEEDPNIYHETITEERLFDEPFANELYEREEGLS
jgi:hypothetical protein